MLKELRYRFRHQNCWLQETTERHPGLTLVVSGIYEVEKEIHVDLTIHAPDSATIDKAEKEWRADPRITKVSRLYDGPRGVRFSVRYPDEHSIYPYILQNTPISLGSISMAAGTEHYTVLGEAEDVQRLVAVLATKGEVKVESVKSLDQVPGTPAPRTDERAGLLEVLTDKQLEALLSAYAGGYYRWPRTVSASKLAEQLDRSSSAFLAHLRQAEAKVLELAVLRLLDEDPGRLDAVQERLKVKRSALSPSEPA